MIFSAKFDYHQIKTIGKKAYRMSSYKVTLNSELGKHITHFHTFLVRLGRYGTRMKVFDNVRKQTHLKSSLDLTTGVITRWNSYHLEQSIASENHSYLEIALKRMICPTDINSDFYTYRWQNLGVVLPSIIDWDVYHQYESTVQPLKQYSEFSQGAMVMFHNEL